MNPGFRYVGLSPQQPSMLARLWPQRGERREIPAAMAVVPWGVIVDDGGAERVLRWAAIDDVTVTHSYRTDRVTPETRHSFVRVVVGPAAYLGRADGDIGLEDLEAHLEAFAREASLPAALDLVDDDAAPPSVDDDLAPRADVILAAGRRHAGPPGYRRAGAPTPTRQPANAMAQILAREPGPVDTRPLACAVAGLMGDPHPLPGLVRLAMAPNPLLAGLARSAALRLGARHGVVGSLDELTAFLPPSDLRALRRFAGSP